MIIPSTRERHDIKSVTSPKRKAPCCSKHFGTFAGSGSDIRAGNDDDEIPQEDVICCEAMGNEEPLDDVAGTAGGAPNENAEGFADS